MPAPRSKKPPRPPDKLLCHCEEGDRPTLQSIACIDSMGKVRFSCRLTVECHRFSVLLPKEVERLLYYN
ncbi:MAG: hypothetical protein ACJZ64_04865 [Opitutales bacterium]